MTETYWCLFVCLFAAWRLCWVFSLSSHLHVLLIQLLSASRGLRIDTIDEGRLLYTGLKWFKTKELLYRLAIAYEPRTKCNICFLKIKIKNTQKTALHSFSKFWQIAEIILVASFLLNRFWRCHATLLQKKRLLTLKPDSFLGLGQ